MSFHEFAEKGARETECETCPPRDAKRTLWLEPSCFAWISLDGAINVDRVLRTETLAEDLGVLCSELGLSATAIPHLNQSHSGSYHSHYDSTTCAYVANRYRKDIDAFGYTFGLS